jgi:hypothetical protein
MAKHTWNHRVLKHEDKDLPYYQIHEVYYEDGKPTSCTKDGVLTWGESLDDLKWQLQKMLEALDNPVLNYDDF